MIENNAIDSMCVMSTQPNSAEHIQQSVDAVSSKSPNLKDVAAALHILTRKVDKLQHNIPKKPKVSHGTNVDYNGNKASLWYYHSTFGDRERKCRPDCRYYQQLN
ncbi:GL22980 [Drosophila persimilis]|uniref:GL22980 n=1 Tax=Drosophila persimilis TaxID=7234 RepID=B4H9T7_DROPE|nr:GL22980 [Drosophila persimilis]